MKATLRLAFVLLTAFYALRASAIETRLAQQQMPPEKQPFDYSEQGGQRMMQIAPEEEPPTKKRKGNNFLYKGQAHPEPEPPTRARK
ncbi:MAG: hypothetical protein HZB28_04425 [Methylocystis sp.]|nr:hypothetical protein [Methylocystis sp.]